MLSHHITVNQTGREQKKTAYLQKMTQMPKQSRRVCLKLHQVFVIRQCIMRLYVQQLVHSLKNGKTAEP